MAGLPQKPAARKRPNDVPNSPTPSFPEAGLIQQPLNSSDFKYQDSPPSSGDSTASKVPPLIINPGYTFFLILTICLLILNFASTSLSCLIHKAKAKTKKWKVGESNVHPAACEQENPSLVTPKLHVECSEAHQNAQDEPPQRIEPQSPETIMAKANPPSPRKTTKVPSHEEEVIVTGTGYTIPVPCQTLTKHTAKGETPLPEKEKTKLDLPNYEGISAEELHVGYLNRLFTSRDMEASLVSMMRKKYEVCSAFIVYAMYIPF